MTDDTLTRRFSPGEVRVMRAQANAAVLLARHESGENKTAIARSLGVTRQRVQQIIAYAQLQRDLSQKEDV